MDTVRVPSQLNDSIAEVISVLEKQFVKEGIEVKKSFDPHLPLVYLDESKLQQVWMNLLLNAKQAVRRGEGLITIATRYDEASGMISVIIEDNGEGMSPEIIHKIFDPFFTTKKVGEGTGLGLSVSYGIIREHGGDIKVKSRPAAGSVFEVLIPEKMKGLGYGDERKSG